MIINTHYYGSVEYTEEELVTFPEGLFGFSDLKQYLPLGLDDGDGSLLLLQSIENPDIAFFLINPPAILPDYCPALQPEELDFLQVSSSDELSYYSRSGLFLSSSSKICLSLLRSTWFITSAT